MKIAKKDIPREIFEIVYQWGRVGIVTDEKCNAFQDLLKDYRNQIIREVIDLVGNTRFPNTNKYKEGSPYRMYAIAFNTALQDLKSKLKDLLV